MRVLTHCRLLGALRYFFLGYSAGHKMYLITEAMEHELAMPLSSAFKAGTAAVHREVEQTPFVQTFLRGALEKERYAQFMQALLSVYRAMEDVLQKHKDDVPVGPVYQPELFRQEAIREDLAFLGPQPIEEGDAVRAYVSRIVEIGREDPRLVVAHAYVRYLGDLSGGQILRKLAQKHLRLPDEGLNFYRFGDGSADSIQAAQARFRTALDQIPVSEQDVADLVDEAVYAFRLNKRIFEELSIVAC